MEGKKKATTVAKAVSTVLSFKSTVKVRQDDEGYNYVKYREKILNKIKEVSRRFEVSESLIIKIIEFNQ